MRLGFGIVLLLLAFPPWFETIIISPYNTMGVGPEYIRPNVAGLLSFLAELSLFLVIASALTVYSKSDNRKGWKAIAFAIVVTFFAGTSAMKTIWLEIYVIPTIPARD
jgi:chromate transport protein ChrA